MANSTEFLPNVYNWFEPDQVLTDDQLNRLFNYLDQQNRWTRNKLIGIGIVCGLDIVQLPGIIEVTAGCGVTSQGYIIIMDAPQLYTYYIPYAGIDEPADLPFTYPGNLPFYKPFIGSKTIYQLLTDQDHDDLDDDVKGNAQTLSSAANMLGDYAVVLFLEASELDLKNCDMFDCNNKGKQITLNIRALLVKKTELPVLQTKALVQVPKLSTAIAKTTTLSASTSIASKTTTSISRTPKIAGVTGIVSSGLVSAGIRPLNPSVKAPQINLKRFNVPYTDLKTTDDIINAFIKLVDDVTLSAVASALNYCYNQYKDLLGDDATGFPTLYDDLRKQRDNIIQTYPIFIQYFYDFIDDLTKAYYEFRVKVSELLSACCPDENLFPLHLVLGSATAVTKDFEKDSYRTYFIYSPLFAKQENEVSESQFLFKRMQIMVKEYKTVPVGILRAAIIKILPGLYEQAYLSQRVIPYYYTINDPGNELYKYWSYYKTIRGNAAFNLSYNANQYSSDDAVLDPLLYDIERDNFFRIEGHIGVNYQTALTNILQQRQNYNLPFDVVAISADQLPTNVSIGTIPDCNIQDLDTDYKLLLAEFTCKVQTPFCYISTLQYPPPNTGIIFTNNNAGFQTLQDANLQRAANIPNIVAASDTSNANVASSQPQMTAQAAQLSSQDLSFSQFRLQSSLLQTNLSSIVLQPGYQKGDFIRTNCPPSANTIGSTYLASIPGGVFKNPVGLSRFNPDLIYYFNLFEYVDAVESLMMIVAPATLGTVNMTDFATAYKRFSDSLFTVIQSTTEILTDTIPNSDDSTAQLVKNLQMDLVADELTDAVAACFDERLQTLIDEYNSRLQTYQLQLSFYNYYNKHYGLEHKAGVPKGGTFVLVYHPAPVITTTNNPNLNNANFGNIVANTPGINPFTPNTASSFAAQPKTTFVQPQTTFQASTGAANLNTGAKLFLAKRLKITPETNVGKDISSSKSKTTSQSKEASTERIVTPENLAAEQPNIAADISKTSIPITNVEKPVEQPKVTIDVSKTTVPLTNVGTPVEQPNVVADVSKTTVPVTNVNTPIEQPKVTTDIGKVATQVTGTVPDISKVVTGNTGASTAGSQTTTIQKEVGGTILQNTGTRTAGTGILTNTGTATTPKTSGTTTPTPQIAQLPVLDQNTLQILKSFADTSTTLTDAGKQSFLNVLTQANNTLVQSQYNVANDVVIGDFYVPYLCCSDCAPIAYILPPQQTEEPPAFSIDATEYVFNDAHNYPFTAQPPVTDANKGEDPFSSPDVDNPGNLNLLTDDANIMYLHPAMPDLDETFTAAITYQKISINITIIKPDATFSLNQTVDANGRPALQPVPEDLNADGYTWTVNGVDGIFENTKNPSPVAVADIQAKVDSSSLLTVELEMSYTRNSVIAEDTKQQVFQPSICIDFEAPQFELGTEYGVRVQQQVGQVIFTTPEKITASIFSYQFSEDSNFGVGQIVTSPTNFGSGQSLEINSLDVKFDYSQSSIQPVMVTIEFLLTDPLIIINFTINDDDKNFYIGTIDKLPSQIGNVPIQRTTAKDGSAQLLLTGAIKSFLIGAQSITIDNICAQ